MHTQLYTINLEIFIVKNFIIDGKMHVYIINVNMLQGYEKFFNVKICHTKVS